MGSQRVGHNWATFTHSLTDFLNCEKEILRYTWKRKYFLYKLVTQWMNNSTNQHFGRLSLIKRHGRCRFFLTMITSQDFKRIDKTFFLQVKISFSWTLLSRDVLYACIQCAPRFQGKVKGTVLYYQWKYLEYHALYPILSQEPISTIKTPNLLFFFFADFFWGASLGLCCCAWAISSCDKWGLPLVAVLYSMRLRTCGLQ